MSGALAPLAWIGRQGTRAVAVVVFVGIAVPPLGERFAPYVAHAIFVLLCIAFLRLEPRVLRTTVRRPGFVVLAVSWTSLVIPGAFALAASASGLADAHPELFLALLLQAAASPMMAAPALTALLGLDATLVLLALIGSSALVPLTVPLFVHGFVADALALSPLAIGLDLLAMLAGSALLGTALRRFIGRAAIDRHRDAIDGLNLIALFVFAAALMNGVAGAFAERPLRVVGLTALGFAVYALLLIATAAVFRPAGAERAFVLGFMAAQRNMGLMLAVTGGAVPELVWLYFALAQIPVYVAPQILAPMVRRRFVR